MRLKSDRELANTRSKLAEVIRLIHRAEQAKGVGQSTELRSLRRLADQLKGEIANYRAAVQVAQDAER